MNGFKKLVLCSAMLAASGSAMALQAMDDDSMSTTTGQDGISINVASSTIADLDITWVDRGGFGAPYNADGAVVITNLGVAITDLDIDVDAGSNVAGDAQLNVDISTIQDIVVTLNSSTIEVGAGTPGLSTVTNNTPIVKFGATSTLTLTGGLNANLKLGNRTATEAFMTLDVANPFDVTLTDMTILDSYATTLNGVNDVGIGIDALSISQVDLHMAVTLVDQGLRIDTTGTSIGEVGIERVTLGEQVATNQPIGDIYLNGLTANTIMTVSGK